jgi:hypothetical protein
MSAASLLRQVLGEVVRLDFKSVRTLSGLLRPGYLTAEYRAGRRQRFLSPLKTYLLAAALFFVAAPFVFGLSLEHLLQDDPSGTWRALVDQRLVETGRTFAVFAAHFATRLRLMYTLSLGLSVLVCAVLLRVLYARTAPNFAAHAVFALHYVGFFYFAVLIVNALNQLLNQPDPWVLLLVQNAILAPYVYLAMRRVYAENAVRTALKCAAMLLTALLLDGPIELATMRLAIALT